MYINIEFETCQCGCRKIEYFVKTGVDGFRTVTEIRCSECKSNLKKGK